jgi:nucleotide-binding universal stress UspA family protein
MNPPLTILVPTDFSAAADAALDFALELGERLAARYLLLHVVPVDDGDAPLPLPGPAGPGDQWSRLREDAATGLDRRLDLLRNGRLECGDHPADS